MQHLISNISWQLRMCKPTININHGGIDQRNSRVHVDPKHETHSGKTWVKMSRGIAIPPVWYTGHAPLLLALKPGKNQGRVAKIYRLFNLGQNWLYIIYTSTTQTEWLDTYYIPKSPYSVVLDVDRYLGLTTLLQTAQPCHWNAFDIWGKTILN